MEITEIKQKMRHCNGTENYYKDFLGLIITDGIKMLVNDAKCNWLVSDIAVITRTKLRGEEFISINITASENKAEVVYDNGDGTVLFKQEYTYTDFPEGTLQLFYDHGVLMIPQEY